MEAARTLQPAFESGSGLAAQEAALVDGLKAGSEEAFAFVLSRYRNPIYALIARILGNDSDAADVLQNVFIKVFRGLPQFQAHSSLKTWIYRIAVREALNHRRGWFRRHVHEPSSLDDKLSGGMESLTAASRAGDPYEKLELAERRQLVHAALNALPVAYRAVLLLREMEDFPYDEIAEVLAIPEGTVKSRLMRGRELLRRKLGSVLGY